MSAVKPRPISGIGSALWNLVIHHVWATWWGGLCFYAIVVVPLGTGAIGSVGQGFITQKVTLVHNAIAVIFLLCLIIEAFRRKNHMLRVMALILLLNIIALAYWHSHLTGMMDFQNRSVPRNFYSEHAIYLWLIAIEWGTGLILPCWLFPRVRTES